MISTQVYSLFSDLPPRPAVPEFRLPDCYSVTNVQPLENKINSFNEETLMWIFYSCPGDIQQHKAAAELYVIPLFPSPNLFSFSTRQLFANRFAETTATGDGIKSSRCG